MEKMNHNLATKQIGKLNSIFYKHNITLSFENIEEYYNCFDELLETAYEFKKQQLIDKISFKTIQEYDFKIGDTVITKSLLYYYDSVLLHNDEKIHQQMTSIRDFFHFNYDYYTIFDVDSFFGVAYDYDMRVKQGYYYTIMPGLLSNLSSDGFDNLFKALQISESNIDILNCFKEECDVFDLYYFSFDSINIVRNIGLIVEKSDVVVDRLLNAYGNYCNFYEIADFLRNDCEETCIGLQYNTDRKNEKYFSIELRCNTSQLIKYFNIFYEKKILKRNSIHDSILQKNMNKDSYVIKFKWSSENKMTTKFYTVEFNKDILEGNNSVDNLIREIHGA